MCDVIEFVRKVMQHYVSTSWNVSLVLNRKYYGEVRVRRSTSINEKSKESATMLRRMVFTKYRHSYKEKFSSATRVRNLKHLKTGQKIWTKKSTRWNQHMKKLTRTPNGDPLEKASLTKQTHLQGFLSDRHMRIQHVWSSRWSAETPTLPYDANEIEHPRMILYSNPFLRRHDNLQRQVSVNLRYPNDNITNHLEYCRRNLPANRQLCRTTQQQQITSVSFCFP